MSDTDKGRPAAETEMLPQTGFDVAAGPAPEVEDGPQPIKPEPREYAAVYDFEDKPKTTYKKKQEPAGEPAEKPAGAKSTYTVGKAAPRPKAESVVFKDTAGPTGFNWKNLNRRNTKNVFVRLGRNLFRPERAWFTICLFLGFAVIVGVIIYMVMQMGKFNINEPVYRYDTGYRYEYEGATQLSRQEDRFYLKNGDTEVQLEDAPLYYATDDRLLLTNMMLMVFPQDGMAPRRTNYYTEVLNAENGWMLRSGGRQVKVDDGFLFDGTNLYIFLEPVTVTFGESTVEMPALSYGVVHYNLRLELYPLDGEPVVLQTGETQVLATAKSGNYTVNMSLDILQTEAGERLLFTQPSILAPITE